MASKRSQAKPSKSVDSELLKSEVAAFASSLGFASSIPSSGFDDSDFRKTGPMKPPNPPIRPKDPILAQDRTAKGGKSPHNAEKRKKSPLDNINPFGSSGRAPEKPKGARFPLVRAESLSQQWHEDAEELERKVLGNEGVKIAPKGLEELRGVAEKKREIGERLMQQFAEDYHSSRRKNKDMLMVESAVKSGTTADKVSALTCMIEDNPVANLKALDSLLHTVTSKVGKRYAFASFDALKELFLCRLLPDRKLKGLLQRPLDSLPESKDGYSLLLFWYWEESLKQRYEQFVSALEDASKDMLPNLKDKAIKLIYTLLCGKAEQERKLLSALVNKLGDPVRKSASGAGYHLSSLLSAHPNMKAVVIDEVDSFIFRPNVGLRAKYHAVNFLSQIFLSKKADGPKLAKRLVDVYFGLFKVLISENSDGGKLNKAHKHKQFEKGKMRVNEKKNRMFKGAVTGGIPDTITEMDSRLLSAILTGVNRAFPYIASEEIDDLVEVQTPILFKLAHSKNFNVGVQALMLLYQISSKNQIASDRFYRALYAKLLVPSALNSSKPELFLSLLLKALKTDININRIAAFVKRILQASLHQPSQYTCACLMLLSEILKARPPLWNMMLQKESADEDLEHFNDIIDDPICGQGTAAAEILTENDTTGVKSSNDKDDQPSTTRLSLPAGYDPRHREPSYCKADLASWWELSVLAAHVHPSVATMARTLLSGVSIVYNGDPLNDLSLVAFLDKFMEKKPKQNPRADGAWHGGSQIAPARKLDMSHQLIGEQILQLAEEDVPPEDIIFHKFYMNKSRSEKKPKKKKKASEDDDDFAEGIDGSDEEIDDELDVEDPLPSGEADEEFDYDDLDAATEDEDGLLEDDEEKDLTALDENEFGADSDMELDAEGGSDEEDKAREQAQTRGKKRKAKKVKKASPFASAEEYEHLMNGEGKESKKRKTKKKS